MSTADHAGQVAHPDEIDTRPTRTPLHMEATSHCLPAPRHRSRMTAVIPPKEAEIVVVAKIRAAVAVAAPSMASVEPALKPYQPIQRIRCRGPAVPTSGRGGVTASGRLAAEAAGAADAPAGPPAAEGSQ